MAGSNKKTAPRHPVPERLLSNLWRKRAARRAWFRSSAGTRMRVLYPGRASSAAGPDFRDALLEVEGVGLVQGDVEIHVRQRDWRGHGHGQDPRYNGVILHAALELDASSTRLQSGQWVPVISLAPLLSSYPDLEDPPAGLPSAVLWTVLGGRGFPQPETAQEMGHLLDRAGDDRFHSKSSRFGSLLEEQDQEQTLYEGILEGLGYHQNRQPFLKLAGRAPYAALMQAAGNLEPERRARAIQDWLTLLSGLAPHLEMSLMPLPKARLGPGLGPAMSAREWHCFRIRPSNHPLRRIAGAARLLDRFLEPGLVAGLSLVAQDANHRELTSALCVQGGPGDAMACIGTARARDLAVNMVLPFLHGLQRLRGEAGHGQAYLDLYRRFGKLQDNDLTREMAGQLLGPAWSSLLSTARRQQGLLHLQRLLCGAGGTLGTLL